MRPARRTPGYTESVAAKNGTESYTVDAKAESSWEEDQRQGEITL